jgi:hypothetical protein
MAKREKRMVAAVNFIMKLADGSWLGVDGKLYRGL